MYAGCDLRVPGCTYSDEHWEHNFPVDADCTNPTDVTFSLYHVQRDSAQSAETEVLLGEVEYAPDVDGADFRIYEQLRELVPTDYDQIKLFQRPGDGLRVRVRSTTAPINVVLYETYC